MTSSSHKPALRVAVNVALLDTKDVKVLEQGVTFFKDLVRIRQKYGLDKWAFEIERHGAAKDPKTTYSILPEQQLSTAQIAEFQALPLHDLVELYAAAEHDELDSYDRKADGNPPAVSSGTPAVTAPPSSPAVAPRAPRAETPAVVDGATAQALATPLKALPREAVERFCTTFGIARIKDLPAAQAAKARSVVDALVAEYDAPPPVPEDVDPFG